MRSFKRTLKSFQRLNSKIKKNRLASNAGRRLRKIVLLVFAALIVVTVAVPPFRFPVDGEVSSGFFLRKRPESLFALDLETHKGIDLAAPEGTRVVSSAPGIVIETGLSDSYGNYVTIRHPLGFETRYAHLREIRTKKGAVVLLRTLKPVGRVGSTGRSTAPHLHFEVRWLGTALPPRFFLVFHGLRKALLGF
ncbi:MAG: M23 family metallopeptidase [Spirochaetales bacterium]|nr:M23 family metallopeptidase [Spirochaetales bacterium]